MATRKNSVYVLGLPDVVLLALNYDLTEPSPSNIIGSAGPFDFSGEADTNAVPITVAIDTVKYEFTVDVAAIVDVDLSAVTASEIVEAITAAAGAETTPVPITVSVDATTGYVKIVATSETASVLQVYGDLARILNIGQGFGVKLFVIETAQSADGTAVKKDSERITVTDASGRDTDKITKEYIKGTTETVVDTAQDLEIEGLINGTFSDGTTMRSGTSEDSHPKFTMTYYYPKYKAGENSEGDIFGYRKKKFGRCMGSLGDSSNKNEFSLDSHTINTVVWTDSSNVLHDAWEISELSIADFEALKLNTLGNL